MCVCVRVCSLVCCGLPPNYILKGTARSNYSYLQAFIFFLLIYRFVWEARLARLFDLWWHLIQVQTSDWKTEKCLNGRREPQGEAAEEAMKE